MADGRSGTPVAALRPLNINAEVPTPFILPFTWYQQQRLYWQLPKLVNVTVSADGVRDPSRYSGLAHDDRQFGLRVTLNQTTALDRYQGYHLVSLAKVNEATLHYVLARCACPCAGSLLGRPNSSSTSSGDTSHGAKTDVPVERQGGDAQPQGMGRAKETEQVAGSSGGSDSSSRGGVSAVAGGTAQGLSSDSRNSTLTDGGEPAPHAQPLTHNPLKRGYCRCPCHTWQEHWPAPSDWCGAGHGQRKGEAQPRAHQRVWSDGEPGSGGDDGEAASDEDRRGLGGAGGERGGRKRGRPPSGRGQAAAGQRPSQRQRLAGPPRQPQERAGQGGTAEPLAGGRRRAGHGGAAGGDAAAAVPAALRRAGSLRRGDPVVDNVLGGAAPSSGAVGAGLGAPARSAGHDGAAAVAPGGAPRQPSRKFRLLRTPQTGRVIGARLEVPQSLLGADVDLRQGAAVDLQLACDGEVWPELHRCELQVEAEGGAALLQVPPAAVGRTFAGWGATFEGSVLLALEPLPRSPQRAPSRHHGLRTARGPEGSRPRGVEEEEHGVGDVDGAARVAVMRGQRWQRGVSPAAAVDHAHAQAARSAHVAAGREHEPKHDGGLQHDGDWAGVLGALPGRLDAFPSEPAPRSGNGSDGSRPRSPGPGPSGPGRPAAGPKGRPAPAGPAGGETLLPSNVLHDYINYCGYLPQEMLLEVDDVLLSQVYGVSLLDPHTREHLTLADMGRFPAGGGAVAVLRGLPPECDGLTISGWGIEPHEATLVLRVSTAPKPQQEARVAAAGVRPAAGALGQGELERQRQEQEQEQYPTGPPAPKRNAASEEHVANGQATQQPQHLLDPVFARRAAAAGVHPTGPRLLPPRPPLRPAAAAPAARAAPAPTPAQHEAQLPTAQQALGELRPCRRASLGPAQPPPADGPPAPRTEPIVVDLTESPTHDPPPDQLLPDNQPLIAQPPPVHPPPQQPLPQRPAPDRPAQRQPTPELAPPPPATAPAPPHSPRAAAPATPPPPLLVCFPGRPPSRPAWDITPLPPVEVPRPGTSLRATCVPLDPAVHARMGGLWGFYRMMVEVDGWVDLASSVRTVRVMQEPRTQATVIERLPAHAVGRAFVGWGVAPGGTVVLRTVRGPPTAHRASGGSSRSNSSGGTGSGGGARPSGSASQDAEAIVAARSAAEAGARVMREHEARRQRLLAAEYLAQAAGGSGGGAGAGDEGGAPPVRRWSPAMDPPDKPARWAPVSIVVAYAPGVQVGLRPGRSGSGEEEDVSAGGTVGGPRGRQLSSSGSGRASGAEGG